MNNVHTPAGYFIAIFAVLGAAWLMPPLPMLILISPFLLLIGIVAAALYGTMRRQGQLDWILFPRARTR